MRSIGLVEEWPAIVGLVVLTGTLTDVAGPTGAVAGLAAALAWYWFGTPYALAVGHVVLVTAFPDGIRPLFFVLIELGFLAFLLASTVRRTALGTDVAVTVAGAVALVGIGWFAAETHPLWIAAGGQLVVFGLAAYAIHRYELVRLGLVSDDHAPETAPTHE